MLLVKMGSEAAASIAQDSCWQASSVIFAAQCSIFGSMNRPSGDW